MGRLLLDHQKTRVILGNLFCLFLSGCFNGEMNWETFPSSDFLVFDGGLPSSAPVHSMLSGVGVSLVSRSNSPAVAGSLAVQLKLFQDSRCQFEVSLLSSSEIVNSHASFPGMTLRSGSGDFFIQASPSEVVSVVPTVCTPFHLVALSPKVLTSLGDLSTSYGSGVTLGLQIQDEYGNLALLPGSGLSVSFSQATSSGQTSLGSVVALSPTLSYSTPLTYSPGESLLVIRAQASSLPSSLPVAIGVHVLPGSAQTLSLTDYQNDLIAGDRTWALISVLDSHGLLATGFTGNVSLGLSGSSAQNTSFTSSDSGMKWIPYTPSVTSSMTGSLAASGAGVVSSIQGGISITPLASGNGCPLQAEFFPSTGTSFDWSNPGIWNPISGTSPGFLGATYQAAYVNRPLALSLGSSVNLQCFFLESGSVAVNSTAGLPTGLKVAQSGGGYFEFYGGSLNLNRSSNAGTVTDSYLQIGSSSSKGDLLDLNDGILTLSGAPLSFQGQVSAFKFSDGALNDPFSVGLMFSGSGAEQIWNNHSSVLSLSQVQESGSDAFVLKGQEIEIGSFSAASGVVYVRNQTTIGSSFVIPSSLSVIVDSGGVLSVSGGMSVAGSLTVRGGGTLQVTGALSASGALKLVGTPGALASLQVAGPSPFLSGSFSAKYFTIASPQGLTLSSTSIQHFSDGNFSGLLGDALTFTGTSSSNPPYFSNLIFDWASSFSGYAIHATTYSSRSIALIDFQSTSGDLSQDLILDPNGIFYGLKQ